MPADQQVDEQLRPRGGDDPEQHDRPERLPAHVVREPRQAEGKHRQGAAGDGGRAELEPADDEAPLDDEARDGVEERRDDDGERARDGPAAAARVHADDDGHAREADAESDEAQAPGALARRDAQGEERHEDRHRRVRDAREPRVHVGLAPRDQQERDRHPDGPDDGARRERGPQGAQAAPGGDEPDQHGRGEQQPQLDERRRRQVADADLDEHERRAPDRGEEQQLRQVGAAHPRWA